jgi:hypothetical protein
MNSQMVSMTNKNTRFGTVKVFRDAKDVIGEVHLDERNFFEYPHDEQRQLFGQRRDSQDFSMDFDGDNLNFSEQNLQISDIQTIPHGMKDRSIIEKSKLGIENMLNTIQEPVR